MRWSYQHDPEYHRILALLATTSPVKLGSQELNKYGLDNPVLRIVFSNASRKEEFDIFKCI